MFYEAAFANLFVTITTLITALFTNHLSALRTIENRIIGTTVTIIHRTCYAFHPLYIFWMVLAESVIARFADISTMVTVFTYMLMTALTEIIAFRTDLFTTFNAILRVPIIECFANALSTIWAGIVSMHIGMLFA